MLMMHAPFTNKLPLLLNARLGKPTVFEHKSDSRNLVSRQSTFLTCIAESLKQICYLDEQVISIKDRQHVTRRDLRF